MKEIMTIEEINDRYRDEWILLGDPASNEALKVLRGEVLCHSKDRDEVYRKAAELRPRRFAFHFTGSLPENTAIIL